MTPSPMVSLASSVHAGPSTFALLLGSGISASSGVLSGWDMTIDLIRRLAELHGQDAGDDPVSWYRAHSDGEPDYSNVVEELAPSSGDRRNLLSSYFEPTEHDRAEGLKVPTRAHQAIARLVAEGFVKVIVTTNFDRLLEAALTNAGAEPSVVSSPSSAAGALPIAHSPCTIDDPLPPHRAHTRQPTLVALGHIRGDGVMRTTGQLAGIPKRPTQVERFQHVRDFLARLHLLLLLDGHGRGDRPFE